MRATFVFSVTLAATVVAAVSVRRPAPFRSTAVLDRALPDEGAFPGFAGATAWLNSPPLSTDATRGKVLVVDFWAFACSNCLAALPHVKALEAKFHDRGVLVVGVHTPELSYEHDPANVQNAVRRLGIVYPVAIDETYHIWHAFNNEYWPAVYIVDARGRIRYHHFGEGAYEEQEQVVDQLLKQASGVAPVDYR